MDNRYRFTLIKRRLSEGGTHREHAEGNESHSLSHIISLRVQAFESFDRFALFNPLLIPPPHREPGSGLNVLNSLNHLNCSVSPRRQWPGACNLFEDCGDLRIAR